LCGELLRYTRNDGVGFVIARNEVTWQSMTCGEALYLALAMDYFALFTMTVIILALLGLW
jgi:hypothetical protein